MKHSHVLALLLLFSTGCSGHEGLWMQGKLIYTPASGIHEIDLETREERFLVQIHGRHEALTNLNGEHFFIDTHREWPSKIQLLDRSTLRFSDLRSGYRPTYMQAHRKFFFFQSSKETGPRLYLADLDDPVSGVKQIAENEEQFSSYTHIIPVSDDEVVFRIQGDAGKTPPYRYNLVTDKLKQLSFTRQCTPYVWRSVSKQLLCGIDGSSEYYLISLDGQRSVPLDLSGLPSKSPLPLLYIPKYDVLILGVARTEWIGSHAGEHWDLWAYSFKDGHSEKLLENNAPGRGGIVWVEQ